MSAATRAKDAKERANIAAGFIRRGHTDTRAFDDCFEMNDGTQVVIYLLAKAITDERVAAFAKRCRWALYSSGAVLWADGTEIEANPSHRDARRCRCESYEYGSGGEVPSANPDCPIHGTTATKEG